MKKVFLNTLQPGGVLEPMPSASLKRFDEFMELALYGSEGFYSTGGGAGRAGRDFLTSPEVGPLFGRLIASKIDSIWDDLGRPQNFTLVDAGAGVGTLARSVFAAKPRCANSLLYVLLERSDVLRREHANLADVAAAHGVHDVLSLRDIKQVTATVTDNGAPPMRDVLPLRDIQQNCRSAGEGSLPQWFSVPFQGAVIANELLDNLPVRLLERTTEGWCEVYVDVKEAVGEEFLFPLPESEESQEIAQEAYKLAPDAAAGARLPLAKEAVAWVGAALGLLSAGSLIVFDYAADTTASLASLPPQEWLRTYRSQARGTSFLEDVGWQDITVEVPLDQILCKSPEAQVSEQASYLRGLGIEEQVALGRQMWRERAAVGDLAALEARSRIREAEALCDPAGLGSFKVLEWSV